MPGSATKGSRPKPKLNRIRLPRIATPSDSESVGDEVVDCDDPDSDQSSLDVQGADGLTLAAKGS